jgi:hypothetical protein
MKAKILIPPAVLLLVGPVLAAPANLPVDLPVAPRRAEATEVVPSPTAPDNLRVAVYAVTTVRTNMNRPDAGTTLQFSFSGPAMIAGSRVTAVRLVKGEDSLGSALVRAPETGGTPRFLAMTGLSPRSGNLTVLGIARAAERIRYLEAELELAPPEKSAGAIVIPDYLAQVGRTLDVPRLLEQELEIIPIDEATAVAYAAEYSGPEIKDCSCQAVFIVRDPRRVLSTLALEDSRGRPVTIQLRSRGNRPDGTLSVVYSLPTGVPDHAALRVELAPTAPARTIRFRLENIELP